MLLIVILGLILITIAYLFIDRSKNLLFICICNIGSVIYLLAYILILLKYGGYHRTAQFVLCISPRITNFLCYLPISADNLSFMLVLGKSLFLAGALLLSINFFEFKSISVRQLFLAFTMITIIIHFILLHPKVFSLYCNLESFREHQNTLFNLIRLYYLLGIICSLVLMISCVYKISIPWIRSKFLLVLILCGIMDFLFLIIGILGPIQISYPNNLYYLSSNFLYSQSKLPWLLIFISSLVCLFIGSNAFLKYSEINKRIAEPDFNIEKKLRKNRDSVSMITHGMKNQLLVLNAIVNDFKNNPAIKTDDSRINDMENTCMLMLDKINQLHNIFSKRSMAFSVTDPVEIINEALHRVKTNIQIETMIFQYSDIFADKQYLEEALINLIRNALESIERSDNTEEGLVQIKLYMSRNEVVFEVKDNGEGIEKKNIKHIFDPFYSNKNSRNNWGLGLSFVQHIVQEHFGKISIESIIGEGTTIYVTIPQYRRSGWKNPK